MDRSPADTSPAVGSIEALLAHASWLDELARHLVADPHEADEIVQETWIAALKHPPFASVPLRAWLARVARNFALQRGRSETARRQRERLVSREEASSNESDALERARTHQRLVAAVLALREPYRATIVMHYFDRLTIVEVAVKQNVPESTVRTRLSRAIGMLRERFQGEDGAEWMSALAPLVPAMRNAKISAVSTTAAASSAPLLAGVGGVAMATMWKVGAGVAAALVLGWWFWPSRDTSVSSLAAQSPSTTNVDALATDSHDIAGQRVAVNGSHDAAPTSALSSSSHTSSASLDVRVRWGDDNAPASDVIVIVMRSSLIDPFDRHASRADSLGNAHFEGLASVEYEVACDRACRAKIKLEPVSTAQCDLVIPDGIDVDGSVVNDANEPVPNARIRLSGRSEQFEELDVARSDALGRFQIRDVGPSHSVTARADGFGPAGTQEIGPSKPGSRVNVKLTMSRDHATIAGVVRAIGGQPIADAEVKLAGFALMQLKKTGGSQTTHMPDSYAHTNAAGAFEVRGVPIGKVKVSVHASDFVGWGTEVVCKPGARTDLEVQLHPQASVHGRVITASGKLLGDAYVGGSSGITASGTLSLADGSYRVGRLPSGSVELMVDGDPDGRARHTFELKEGDDVEFDFVLDAPVAAKVVGRVLDESGQPCADWRVGAVKPESTGLFLSSAQTDATGRFTLNNWPAEADTIAVFDSSDWFGEPAALVRDVKPGGAEISIRISKSARSNVFIVGRVLDADGRGASAAQVTASSVVTHSGRPVFVDDAGRFRIGPLRSGGYELYVRLEGYAWRLLPVVQLAAEETLDVGEIQMERPGSLVVHVRAPPSTIPARIDGSLTLRSSYGHPVYSSAIQDGECVFGELDPGEFTLILWSETLRIPHMSVKIEAGKTTELTLMTLPATSRIIHVVFPDDAKFPARVRVRATNSAGDVVFDLDSNASRERPHDYGVSALEVGAFAVDVSTDTGLSAHANIFVESLAPASDAIELRLH